MDLLKLGALLDSDKYIIPVYQREFAWSEGELIRLVKDIEDSRKEGKEEYYMGSLVTFFIDGYYELVDGQQRLTALSLLFSLSGDGKKINLSYEARPSSVKSLEELQKGKTGSGHRFFKSAQILKSELEKTDKRACLYIKNHFK